MMWADGTANNSSMEVVGETKIALGHTEDVWINAKDNKQVSLAYRLTIINNISLKCISLQTKQLNIAVF